MSKLIKLGYRALTPIVLSVLLIATPFRYVYAAIDSCNANVTPATVQPNSQTMYNFNITNNGPGAITWIQILRPSTNFVITNPVWSGSSSTGDDQTTMYGGTDLASGTSSDIGVSAHAGEDQTSGENWTVLVSENSDGSDPTTCSGSLGASVAGEKVPDPDTTPPSIDQVALSRLSSSSITISWVTDEPANSDISYGETGDYGQTNHSDSLVTEHSLTLNNLTPDTSYHFMVTSYDPYGNGVSTSDNTFLTPVAGTAPTPGGGTPNLPNGSALKTPIPLKAIPTEKIPPTIQLTTDFSLPQKNTPTILGTAEDNDALAGIFYSLDGGKNWLPVDSAPGLGTKKTEFSFTPQNLQDGNYQLSAKAIDTSNNQTNTAVQTLVIDRLPPIVGGNVIAVGSQILLPNNDNVVNSLVGVDQKITLSAVGGPTAITVVTTELGKAKELQSFSLTQSADSGLWSGVLSYSKPGTYQLVANSVDGAGNKTSRALNIVNVSQAGRVVDSKDKSVKAKVTVYTREAETNSWVLWDGEAYDQPNPTTVTPKGTYGLYLPEGTYYLKIEADGFKTIVTRSFILDSDGIINSNFKLNRKPGLDLGPIHFRLPWPVLTGTEMNNSTSNYTAPKSAVTDQPLPQFSLPQTNGKNITTPELYGKPTILTFINTWSASTSGQLATLGSLDEPFLNVLAVGSGESPARLSVYAKLTAYNSPIVVDGDNQLIDALKGSTVPVTYFIDRHGVVKKVMVGVLSKEELLNYVSL